MLSMISSPFSSDVTGVTPTGVAFVSGEPFRHLRKHQTPLGLHLPELLLCQANHVVIFGSIKRHWGYTYRSCFCVRRTMSSSSEASNATGVTPTGVAVVSGERFHHIR